MQGCRIGDPMLFVMTHTPLMSFPCSSKQAYRSIVLHWADTSLESHLYLIMPPLFPCKLADLNFTAAQSQPAERDSDSEPGPPYILEIHPDFSIPVKYRPPTPQRAPSLSRRPATPITPAAIQQLPSSPGLSSCSCGTSMQELSERLESVIQEGSLVPPPLLIPPHLIS